MLSLQAIPALGRRDDPAALGDHLGMKKFRRADPRRAAAENSKKLGIEV
jgi:hypothetical protein